MNQQSGKYVVVFGLLIAVVGLLVYFFHDKLHWLGRLPGDVRIERENFRFYFPFTTMVLISLLLALVVNILKRL